MTVPQVQFVSFYRRVVGKSLSHLTRIDRIEVPATGRDIAAAAIIEFERKHGVDDWHRLADRYRVMTPEFRN